MEVLTCVGALVKATESSDGAARDERKETGLCVLVLLGS